MEASQIDEAAPAEASPFEYFSKLDYSGRFVTAGLVDEEGGVNIYKADQSDYNDSVNANEGE